MTLFDVGVYSSFKLVQVGFHLYKDSIKNSFGTVYLMKKLIFCVVLLMSFDANAWRANPALTPAEILMQNVVHHLKEKYVRDLNEAIAAYNGAKTKENAQRILTLQLTFRQLIPDLDDTLMRIQIACAYFLVWENDFDDMEVLKKSASMWLSLHEEGREFVAKETIELVVISFMGAYMADQTQTQYLEKCAEVFEAAEDELKEELPTRGLYNAGMCYAILCKLGGDREVEYIERAAELFERAHKRGDFEPTWQMASAAVGAFLGIALCDWAEDKHYEYCAVFYAILLKKLSSEHPLLQQITSTLTRNFDCKFADDEHRKKSVIFFCLIVRECGSLTPQEILIPARENWHCISRVKGKGYLPHKVLEAWFGSQVKLSQSDYMLSASFHYELCFANSQDYNNSDFYEEVFDFSDSNKLIHLAKAAKRYEKAAKLSVDRVEVNAIRRAAICHFILLREGILPKSALPKVIQFYDRHFEAEVHEPWDIPGLKSLILMLSDLYERTHETWALVKCLDYMTHASQEGLCLGDSNNLKMILRYLIDFMNTAPGKVSILDEYIDLGFKVIKKARETNKWARNIKKPDEEFDTLETAFRVLVENR